MKFSAELFKNDTVPSLDTPYEKEHSGAFYDVYEDENGGLHMDKKDEESLRERLYFYQRYFVKERYPIYLEDGVSLEESSLEEQIFSQALGLPLVALTRTGKSGTRFYVSPGEVLERITFEDNLHCGYGNLPSPLNESILLGDSYSVIGAMNYLIANGIFLQDIQRILFPHRENGMFYPVHIHEEKLPEKLKNEKETGAKLFMDFCSSPLIFDKNSYLRTYGRIDSMSLEEQAEIAFEDIQALKDEQEKELRLSLRRYFLSLAREIVAEFYWKEYHCSFLSPSLLSHKIPNDNFIVEDVYSGPVFSMVRLRSYTVLEKDTDMELKKEYSPYLLKKEDVKKLKIAYETVNRYFRSHPALCHLPQIFLRLMGLPYPAFQAAKYFDFSRGDFKELVQVIGTASVSLMEAGYQEPILSSDGVLRDPEASENPVANIVFYHNHSLPSCYLSNPMIFFGEGEMDFLCSWGKQNSVLYRFFSGDADFINQLLSEDSWLYHTPLENGTYLVIRDFFQYLNDGYSALEAYSFLSDRIEVDRLVFFYFITAILCFLLGNSANQYWNKTIRHAGDMSKSNFSIRVIHPDKKEDRLVVDRNFVFFYYPDRNPCYSLPESDYEIFEKVNRNYKKFYDGLYAMERNGAVYYRYTAFDDIRKTQSGKIEKTGSLVRSIFEDDRWSRIIDDIPELSAIRAFRMALCQGVLIPGEVSGYHPFIFTGNKKKEKRLSALLDYELIASVVDFEMSRISNPYFYDEVGIIKNTLDDYFGLAYISPSDYDGPQDRKGKLALYYCEMVEKWYLDDLKGKDSFSPFHPIAVPYDGKTRYKMLGQLFDAYSYRTDFDSFYLLKKDRKRLVRIINAFCEDKRRCVNEKKIERNAAFLTGLPFIFSKKLKELYSKEDHVDEKKLMHYFTFRDEKESETDYYVDEDCQWKKNTIGSFYRSPKLKRRLMEEGLVLYYDTDLFDFDLFQYQYDEQGYLNYPFHKLTCHVLDGMSSDVKTYLEPNEVLLSELIQSFGMIAKCHNDIDYDILNDVCRYILNGCKENRHFLPYLINGLQGAEDWIHSYTEFLSFLRNPEAMEQERKFRIEYIYILSFLLFLERNIILGVGKKSVER